MMPSLKPYDEMSNDELESSDYGRGDVSIPEMFCGCLVIIACGYVALRFIIWLLGFFI